MYERFTDRARKAMQLANQEAQRFNHEYIGPEHVLLGVVKEGSGVAANALKNLDIDLRKVRLEIEKLIQSGPEMVTMGKLPQTPKTKQVTQHAMAAARELNHNYVGTEHLLIALVEVPENVAGQVLAKLGLEGASVRETILALLGSPGDSYRGPNAVPEEVVPMDWYESAAERKRQEMNSLIDHATLGLPPYRPHAGAPLELVLDVLNRSWRNSVLITGTPGVGKRALVEKLAVEMASGHSSVTEATADDLKEVSLVGRDDEDKAKVMKRLKLFKRSSLLFIEDLQLGLRPDFDINVPADVRRRKSMIRRRFTVWPLSFGDQLLGVLRSGVRCIATLPSDSLELMQSYPELASHFVVVNVQPPKKKKTREIVKSRADAFKAKYNVRLSDEAIEVAYDLAQSHGDRLYPNHAQPSLTMDVIEQSASRVGWKNAADGKRTGETELSAHDVYVSVAARLGKDVIDLKKAR